MNEEYEQLKKGTNLFVGAHPDDNFLAACNLIRANPENSMVMTLTNGAPPFKESYPISGIEGVTTAEQYGRLRQQEEIAVMQALGVPDQNIALLGYNDQESFLHMDQLIDFLVRLLEDCQPARVFTHEWPQAHPDHEVASFCVNQAVKEAGLADIAVLEFPMYRLNPDGSRVNCTLTPSADEKIVAHAFSQEELAFRNRIIGLYETQPQLPDKYTTFGEQFRVLPEPRDFSGNLAGSTYLKPWIKEMTPEIIREKIELVRISRND